MAIMTKNRHRRGMRSVGEGCNFRSGRQGCVFEGDTTEMRAGATGAGEHDQRGIQKDE